MNKRVAFKDLAVGSQYKVTGDLGELVTFEPSNTSGVVTVLKWPGLTEVLCSGVMFDGDIDHGGWWVQATAKFYKLKGDSDAQ